MSATHTVEGVALPSAGTWKIDPSHAEIGFWARHMMIAKVRGRFTGIDAVAEIAERPEDSTITATIDMSSVTTGDAQRDEHLRSADFFDVEQFPSASFRSTGITWNGDTTGAIDGVLTIKDVEHPISMEMEFVGALMDPWGNPRAAFEARTKANREDWGLTWNMALETGGVLVSKEIHLEFHLEFVKAS